jgi:hypothetical protein
LDRRTPYLTQRLCAPITEQGKSNWSEADVECVVSNTFFGEMSKQDNNLQFVRDMLTKRAPDLFSVLTTYRDIREASALFLMKSSHWSNPPQAFRHCAS